MQGASLTTGFPAPHGYASGGNIYAYWRQGWQRRAVDSSPSSDDSDRAAQRRGPHAAPSATAAAAAATAWAPAAPVAAPVAPLPHECTAPFPSSSQPPVPWWWDSDSEEEEEEEEWAGLGAAYVKPGHPPGGYPLAGGPRQHSAPNSGVGLEPSRGPASGGEYTPPEGEPGEGAALGAGPHLMQPVFRAAPYAAELERQRQAKHTVRLLFVDEGARPVGFAEPG